MSEHNPEGPFGKYGLDLVWNNYDLVPIPLGGKGPSTLPQWQKNFAHDSATYLAIAKRHSHEGVGIVTGRVVGFDFDLVSPGASEHMIEWARDNIDDAPVRIGKAPKMLMLFRCDEPFTKVASNRWYDPDHPELDPKRKGQRMEVLGQGQQFVAYHTHPETGKPYRWTVDGLNPLDVAREDLPLVNAVHAEATVREFDRWAKEQGWELLSTGFNGNHINGVDVLDDPLAVVAPPDETPEEVARVQSALDAMKPHSSEYEYDEYIKTVFALKWTKWFCAENLAREWSETSSKHDAKRFNTIWKGAEKQQRQNPITLGTLFKMAKAVGWDASRTPNLEAETTELQEILDEIDLLDPENSKAVTSVQRKLANANLSSTSEEKCLKALKDVTKIGITTLRKDLKRFHIKPDKKTTHAGYARTLLANLRKKTGAIPACLEGKIYTYSKTTGIWEGHEASNYEVEVAESFDGKQHCERRNDYMAIANHVYSIGSRGTEEFFADASVGLACNGYLYSVDDDRQIIKEPLKSEHKQRILSPTRPVLGKMPMFEKFLDETFAGSDKIGQIRLVQEILGAALLGLTAKYEKVVQFHGGGRAGKGTLLKITEATFPKEARSAVTPFKWNNEYYLASLAAMRLNVVGELPDDEAIPASYFKTVTGRDTLTGRHPTHRPFTFRNEATHIFNTNYFVFTKDHSPAFFNRWIMIEFPNSRAGRDEDLDINLAKHIIDNELSAIMAWALQGAKRLQHRGRFELTHTHHRLMDEWQHRASTLLEFLFDRDECRVGNAKTEYTRRPAFYEAYSKWCRESNRRPLGKQKLYSEIEGDRVAKLGVHFGTDLNGNDVIRGVLIKSADFLAFKDTTVDDDEL